jgi:hypothetical protein
MEIFREKSEPGKKDRRKRPRIAFRIPATVLDLNEKVQILDFSMGGFFVQTDIAGKLEAGRQVRLALRFPDEEKISIIKVKIVRTADNGFGCRFVNLDPPLYELLERNFNIFSATLPIE